MLLLIILFSLLKTFPISSPKNKHGNRYYRKEDKYVGILWVYAPKCGDLINGNGRYGQVKVFGIS